MIRFKSPLAPAVTTIGDKTFVVGGGVEWLEVPAETTLADIKWIAPKRKKVTLPKMFTKEVPSSRGDKMYTLIVREDGVKSCTCSGFMYRRRCRHLEFFKKELGI